MADVKTSAETAASGVNDADYFRAVQSGGNVKTTFSQVKTWVLAFLRGALPGSTTGTAVTAGSVGEVIRAEVAIGSAATAPATNVAGNVTSISLTPGIWDITAMLGVSGGGSVSTLIQNIVSISTTSATISTATGFVAYQFVGGSSGIDIGSSSQCNTLPNIRVNVTSTTTYYLVGRASYSGNAVKFWGAIEAHRVA